MSKIKQEMKVKISVNNQLVYIMHETEDYYIVSLYSDGTCKFKADKMNTNDNK